MNYHDENKIDYILNKIESINTEYKMTHFEFINDSSNWDKIDDFCNNVKANSINILVTDESFIREIFYLDFYKVQEVILSQYIKENVINNKDIIDKEKNLFGLDKEHDFLELIMDLSGVAYEYNIKDIYKFNFLVKFDEKENKMRLIISKRMEKIKQNKMILKIIESFKCKSGLFEINKKNLTDFFYNFFNDINKYNVTNENIIEDIGLVKNKTRTLLEKGYKNMNLIDFFKPDDLKSESCNDFSNFENVFIKCLASDVNDSFKDIDSFRMKEDIDNIYVFFSNIESYEIKINDSDLQIYCDDIKLLEWNNFENLYDIKEKIETFLRNDIIRIFKRNDSDELKLKEDVLNILKKFFNNQSVLIECSPFYKQTVENIVSLKIPVKIKLNDDYLIKNIDEIIEKDLNKDKELITFREKMKIKSNISLKDSTCEVKNKKRI